jgi:hypothetical protein
MPTVRQHDLTANAQAQPGAAPLLPFCLDKRLKDTFALFRGNTGPCIFNH